MKDLIPLTLIAIVVTSGPTIAYKLNAPINGMKYLTTLAMVFSIFYYDKKFTTRIAIISYVLLVVSLYFRSLNVVQIEFDTSFTWFVSRSLGFLLEAVVMSLVCIKIVDVSHNMLVKFADTQQTAELVDQCNAAAGDPGRL